METNKNNAPLEEPRVEEIRDLAVAKVNKKIIVWSLIAIAVLLVVAGVGYWMHSAGEKKAQEAIGAADIELNDSIKFEMYKKVADDGSYKPNERAKLMVAIKYYQDGKYKEALEYLDGVSVSSDIIGAGALSLQGDCYANLGKLDDALKCYSSALDEANSNPQIVPFILVKEANVYRAQKDYEREYDVYETIRRDYPNFMYDVDKYYERAKAAAGK